MSSAEIDQIFPKDAYVPPDLNFQDFDEDMPHSAIDMFTFVTWLSEGQHDCDVARCLGAKWAKDLSGAGNETMSDFFNGLLSDYNDEYGKDQAPDADAVNALPIPWLATFVHNVCAPFSFNITGETNEEQIEMLGVKIAEEIQAVQSYTRALRSTGVMPVEAPRNVEKKLTEEVEDTVHPWPTVLEQPLPEISDGQFALSLIHI